MAKKKARLTKEGLEVDLSGVSARERRVKKVIPEGIYRAKVVSVGPRKYSTDRRGVEWVVEVIDDGPGRGARFWHNNVFIDTDGSVMTDSLWTIRGTLQALSPKVKIPEKLSKFPWSKLEGRTVAIEVADGEDNEGRPRSEILDVFNEDLIEDETGPVEDEEDEDEEDWEEEEDDFEEDEDEEDEDFEDEDEDEDEDEEPEDYHEMDAKTLRSYARDQGIAVKGKKKADLLEELDEMFEEDEEDEDEFDLEEDEL